MENMDPDCAICSKPARAQCDCEAHGLDLAVRQAEQRMMSAMYTEIRTWVRGNAQDYILSYFAMLSTRRREVHAAAIRGVSERARYYQSHPHPQEIALIDAELKRGIDDDWKASVQRYPEVLEYFYGLVDLSLPPASDPSVRDPPLSALSGGQPQRERKVRLREPSDRDRPSTSRRKEKERDRDRDKDRGRDRGTPAPEPPRRERSYVRESGRERGGGGGDRRSMGPGMAGMGGGRYAGMPMGGAGLGYGYVPAGGY